MGHITVDRLETAWERLSKAEHLAKNNQTQGAILECENAIQYLQESSAGMGKEVWFTKKSQSIEEKIGELKFETEPNKDDTFSVIDECRELTKQTSEEVIPELHSRIEYNPTPSFD